jgi:hypothetical protein
MGKKLALCVGINNYPGTANDLRGCVNDADDWALELSSRGFTVQKLIDAKATKANMTSNIRGLLEQADSGDVVVFTYSGHGTWLPDVSGDEPDQRDEALCPHDMANGPLVDDELYEIYSGRARGTRLICISDSCHSGSVNRFAVDAESDRKIRFLNPAFYEQDETKLKAMRALERSPSRGNERTGAVLMSGCTDIEYSYDASFGGRANGAFTRAALDTLKSAKPKSYRDWVLAIRKRLPSTSYPQTPKLVGTSSQRKWPVFE